MEMTDDKSLMARQADGVSDRLKTDYYKTL